MNIKNKFKTTSVTFKTSPDTLYKLEQIAELRGLTRSSLLALMAEAVVDGKLPLGYRLISRDTQPPEICLGIAQKTMGEEMSAVVWQMSRSLYQNGSDS